MGGAPPPSLAAFSRSAFALLPGFPQILFGLGVNFPAFFFHLVLYGTKRGSLGGRRLAVYVRMNMHMCVPQGQTGDGVMG